jgi:hypothetical protein
LGQINFYLLALILGLSFTDAASSAENTPNKKHAQFILKVFHQHETVGSLLKTMGRDPFLTKAQKSNLEAAARFYSKTKLTIPEINKNVLSFSDSKTAYKMEIFNKGVAINGAKMEIPWPAPFERRLNTLLEIKASKETQQKSKKFSSLSFFFGTAYANFQPPPRNESIVASTALAQGIAAGLECENGQQTSNTACASPESYADSDSSDEMRRVWENFIQQAESPQGRLRTCRREIVSATILVEMGRNAMDEANTTGLDVRKLKCEQTAAGVARTSFEIYDSQTQKTVVVSSQPLTREHILIARMDGLEMHYRTTFPGEINPPEVTPTTIEYRWGTPHANSRTQALWAVEKAEWNDESRGRGIRVHPDRIESQIAALTDQEQVYLTQQGRNFSRTDRQRRMTPQERENIAQNGNVLARVLQNLVLSDFADICEACEGVGNIEEIFASIQRGESGPGESINLRRTNRDGAPRQQAPGTR